MSSFEFDLDVEKIDMGNIPKESQLCVSFLSVIFVNLISTKDIKTAVSVLCAEVVALATALDDTPDNVLETISEIIKENPLPQEGEERL